MPPDFSGGIFCYMDIRSDFHCNVVCSPDYGTEIADCKTVTYKVCFTVGCKRIGNVTCTADYRIAGDFKALAVLTYTDDGAVLDLFKSGLKVYGNVVECEPFSEI